MHKYLLRILDEFFPRWLTDLYMQKCPSLYFLKPIGEDPALFGKIAKECDTYAGKRYLEILLSYFQRLNKDNVEAVSLREQIVFVGILAVLAKYRQPNILDLGGGVGGDYFICKNFCGKSLGKWIIVETSHLVEKLAPLVKAENNLVVTDRINNIIFPIHLAYIGGTLQYLDPPFKYIDEIIKFNPYCIYINKTPFWDKPTMVAKQCGRNILNDNHRKERLTVPIWIFNEKEITNYIVSKNYKKITVNIKCDNYYILKYGILWYKAFLFINNDLADKQ